MLFRSGIDVEAVKADAARSAAKETAEMFALAAKHNKRDLANEAVAKGLSLSEFRGALLEAIGSKPLDDASIGMTKKETRNFSLIRAIAAMANPTDVELQRSAAFEFEASAAAARAAGVTAQGLYIPADILRGWNKRDLNSSDDAAVIGEDYRAVSYTHLTLPTKRIV